MLWPNSESRFSASASERPEGDVSRCCNRSPISISQYLSGVFNFLSSGTTLFKTHISRYEFHDHPCLKNPCYAASHTFTGHKKTEECRCLKKCHKKKDMVTP